MKYTNDIAFEKHISFNYYVEYHQFAAILKT